MSRTGFSSKHSRIPQTQKTRLTLRNLTPKMCSKVAFFAPGNLLMSNIVKSIKKNSPPIMREHEEMEVKKVPFDSIVCDKKFNSRIFYTNIAELENTIATEGLLYPFIVSKDEDRYILRAGFRRYLAIQNIRRKCVNNDEEIPEDLDLVEVKITKKTGVQLLLLHQAENQHESLGVLEIARFVKRVKEEAPDMTMSQIAKSIGKSDSYIYGCIKVIDDCIPSIVKALERGFEDTEFPDGYKIGTAKLFELSKLSKEDQEKEWLKWTGEAAQKEKERIPEPSERTEPLLNRKRIEAYALRLKSYRKTNPSAEMVYQTCLWILRQRKATPLRLGKKAGRKPKAF